MKHLLIVILLLTIGLTSGCGVKKYPNDLEKNLLVRTKTEGSLFTSVEAFMKIYDPGDDCKNEFLGQIDLKNGETPVGIAAGRPTYIDLVFRAGNGYNHLSGIFMFRPGVHYVADVSYVDRIYNYEMHVAGANGKLGREIKGQPRNCPDL